ncbi:LLM class flavin-dependent oxidoreductase [Actinomadura litoris]|uniref:LLM class flavin-dependent oxidoreductase n=1 Tax=Actinomadura litoris TaxID=2678616 RepID=A0A7K1LA30_9ACTN|nr:LLM class flavin-dependent oxidoreductase [Actinomadura litoris]MUN41055.1 LLM class flavin-dependent oxidoreductase [Actinomadura litoris]
MTIEFIGHVDDGPAPGGRAAQEAEAAGFDRVILTYGSSSPDPWLVAAEALRATTRLKILIAHRPGVVAPTVAARKLATLDQFSGGRTSLQVIAGSTDDRHRDGDFLPEDDRYARAREYLDILERELTEPEPFDYEGVHYQVRDAFSEIRPVQTPLIFSDGTSPEALELAARYSDVHVTPAEPLADFARIRQAATEHGRTIEFAIELDPVLGDTEEEARERANATGPDVAPGTLLVGTPRAVADTITDYHRKTGATRFVLGARHHTHTELGERLLPLVRERTAGGSR